MKKQKSIDKKELLRIIRKSGLSLAKIEKLSDVKEGTMNNWFYADARPTLHNATAVLNALGYDLIAVRREE